MIKRLLIILTIVATSICVKAQTTIPTLKVTNISANGIFGFPDTIYGGINYSYLITITNTDTSVTFSNDTNVASGIFTILAQQSDTSLPAFQLYSNNGFLQILPGDSQIIQWTDSFGTGLKLGNNVVVVWPSKVGAGSQPFNIDSTYFNILFIGSSGIDDISIPELRIYPNPFLEKISIENLSESQLTIYIYDASGRIVFHNPLNKKSYDLSFLKEGAYFIEVRKVNRVLARKKLIKS